MQRRTRWVRRTTWVAAVASSVAVLGSAAPATSALLHRGGAGQGAMSRSTPSPDQLLPESAVLPDGVALPPSAPGTLRLKQAQARRAPRTAASTTPTSAPPTSSTTSTTSTSPPSATSTSTATPTPPLAFATADSPRTNLPQQWWPYHRLGPMVLGGGVRDASGVRMYAIGSTLYDHPVLQAQDGIDSVESYAVTKDQRYLNQALGDAHRLVDRRVESRGAWFYPYPFDFALHGNQTDVIHTPWYSGMAQGLSLTLFARLYDQTQDPQWLLALRQTLTSMDLGPTADPSVPFVSWVDGNQRLWLEEYAQLPLSRSDRTINGHMFAMFGLWDAARVTSDPEAVRLFQGAAATMRRYVYDGVRRTFWISAYCLTHQVLDPKYHQAVVQELLYLNAVTTGVDWARFSDRFRDDYPEPHVGGTVVMEPGTVTGYRFDASGNVLATRVLRLSRQSSAPADRRERIRTRGFGYRITAGTLTGYEVMEAYPSVRLQGIWARVSYPFQRVATFPAGPASTYVVNETTGAPSSPRSATLRASSTAHFDRAAYVGGRHYVHIVDGWFAGRWAPSGGLVLS